MESTKVQRRKLKSPVTTLPSILTINNGLMYLPYNKFIVFLHLYKLYDNGTQIS